MFQIQQLSQGYLQQARKLGDSVFYYEKVSPSVEIGANLNKKNFQKFQIKYKNAISTESYIALDDGKVIGISGLYQVKEDSSEGVFWLGWFCIDPEHQGQGVGSMLLDYTIEQANKKNAQCIRLYTSTRPEEAKAQFLYEKKGFKVMSRETKPDGQYEIFYREKTL